MQPIETVEDRIDSLRDQMISRLQKTQMAILCAVYPDRTTFSNSIWPLRAKARLITTLSIENGETEEVLEQLGLLTSDRRATIPVLLYSNNGELIEALPELTIKAYPGVSSAFREEDRYPTIRIRDGKTDKNILSVNVRGRKQDIEFNENVYFFSKWRGLGRKEDGVACLGINLMMDSRVSAALPFEVMLPKEAETIFERKTGILFDQETIDTVIANEMKKHLTLEPQDLPTEARERFRQVAAAQENPDALWQLIVGNVQRLRQDWDPETVKKLWRGKIGEQEFPVKVVGSGNQFSVVIENIQISNGPLAGIKRGRDGNVVIELTYKPDQKEISFRRWAERKETSSLSKPKMNVNNFIRTKEVLVILASMEPDISPSELRKDSHRPHIPKKPQERKKEPRGGHGKPRGKWGWVK